MPLITIPTRTSADLNSAADINALMDNDEYLEGEIPNAAWPVGSFYWQAPSAETNTKATAFPTAEEPGELFGGTWEQRYDDEGVFFKTEGDPLSQTDGENNERTSGLQTDSEQDHWHELKDNDGFEFYRDGTVGGVQGIDQTGHTAGGYFKARTIIASTTGGTPRTGKESRGRNRLMKLWYRTA